MEHEFGPPVEDNLARKIFDVTHSVTNPTIQPDFRLVVPSREFNPPMQEFASDRLGGRFIGIASDDPIAYKHALLSESSDIPVMSSMYPPNRLLLLHVPKGTRPVSGYVNSMRASSRLFGPVFKAIGAACHALEKQHYGLPDATPDYPLLRQFALAPDSISSQGEKLFFLPPYNLNEYQSKQAILNGINQELENAELSPNQSAYLCQQVDAGWTYAIR